MTQELKQDKKTSPGKVAVEQFRSVAVLYKSACDHESTLCVDFLDYQQNLICRKMFKSESEDNGNVLLLLNSVFENFSLKP